MNFRLEDLKDLSQQYFLVLKNIWYYENSMEFVNIDKYKQMDEEEIQTLMYSTKSKIEYLQVSYVFIFQENNFSNENLLSSFFFFLID